MSRIGRHLTSRLFAFVVLCVFAAATRAADDIVLLIQPILSEEQTAQTYRPLADYIGRATGRPCVILTRPNFLAYWETMRHDKGYDLVLDAAHFTDYRVRKFGFKVLVKEPDTVSESLIVAQGTHVTDPAELAGKTVASLGPPSLGAARLNVLFPNPARQPLIVEVDSAQDGLDRLLQGGVAAAVLPTPFVSRLLARGDITDRADSMTAASLPHGSRLHPEGVARAAGRGCPGCGVAVVTTTEPVPNVALSASPRLDPRLRARIRKALLDAANAPEGRKMLAALDIERFDPATAEMYTGQSRVLREYWGY